MRYSNVIQASDYGQGHEMELSDFKGYLGNTSSQKKSPTQLGGFFDDILGNVTNSLTSGLEETKDTLITGTVNSLINDPTVQAAAQKEIEDQALATTAQFQREVVASAKEYWSKYKWGIIAGVVGTSVLGGYLLFGRKKRA